MSVETHTHTVNMWESLLKSSTLLKCSNVSQVLLSLQSSCCLFKSESVVVSSSPRHVSSKSKTCLSCFNTMHRTCRRTGGQVQERHRRKCKKDTVARVLKDTVARVLKDTVARVFSAKCKKDFVSTPTQERYCLNSPIVGAVSRRPVASMYQGMMNDCRRCLEHA